MFDQGDLKYVILQLLDEKPRHGYEIIKALEERSGGAYAPSAGAVYPTLTMLEDLGYATLSADPLGTTSKKIYEITEAGRAYLNENRAQADDVFERVADLGASFLSDGMRDVGRAFAKLARVTFATATTYTRDSTMSDGVREILEKAASEIDALTSTRSK